MDISQNIHISDKEIFISIDNSENKLTENLLDNRECLFCYEIMEGGKRLCDECNYEICLKCSDLYINKYGYKECPHCRHSLIHIINSNDTSNNIENNSCFSELCRFIFHAIISVILFILCIIFGSVILCDKHFNLISGDLIIGGLLFTIIFICCAKCFLKS